MQPVPYPDELVPSDRPHEKKVIGPRDLLDDRAPLPVEALIMDDGFHIRIALEDSDLESLIDNPHLHFVVNAAQLPVFWIEPENKAKEYL